MISENPKRIEVSEEPSTDWESVDPGALQDLFGAQRTRREVLVATLGKMTLWGAIIALGVSSCQIIFGPEERKRPDLLDPLSENDKASFRKEFSRLMDGDFGTLLKEAVKRFLEHATQEEKRYLYAAIQYKRPYQKY